MMLIIVICLIHILYRQSERSFFTPECDGRQRTYKVFWREKCRIPQYDPVLSAFLPYLREKRGELELLYQTFIFYNRKVRNFDFLQLGMEDFYGTAQRYCCER